MVLLSTPWETFDAFEDKWSILELNSNQKTVNDFLFSEGVVDLLAQMFKVSSENHQQMYIAQEC